MSRSTLRRTGAFLASVGLLASLTVATLAAPVSAGKCQAFTGSFPPGAEGCFYATGQIDDSGLLVPTGVTLNGSDADDTVGDVFGTFNGGGGDDTVYWTVYADATFNGGSGNDSAT